MTRRRVAALVAIAAAVAAGLAVHTLLPDTAGSDIGGDALYAAAAYSFVVLLLPRARPVVAGAIAVAWCTAIELFQLTGVPLAAGAGFPPAMLVLGTVFDARDLAVYVVAVAAAAALDAGVRGVSSRVGSSTGRARASRG